MVAIFCLFAGTEAKAIWEKLRHSLRDALRRQKKYMKSGAAAEPTKPWKYQQQMAFLQPYMANTQRQGNLNESQCINIDATQDDAIGNNQIDSVECDEYVNTQNTIDDLDAEQCLERHETPSSHLSATSKKKIHHKDTATSLLKRSMEQHEERRKLRAEERKVIEQHLTSDNDPLYHFFYSMYKTTKEMPRAAQFAVRNDIFRVVTDMEAKLLNIQPGAKPVNRPSLDELSVITSQDTRGPCSS